MNDFFIAVYTTYAKRYCHDLFFERLGMIAGNEYISVIDNSQNKVYLNTLKAVCQKNLKNYTLNRLDIEPGDKIFLRSVGASVRALQDEFLQSDKAYFLIIESDVMPPVDLLDQLRKIIDLGDIIGGIYYPGPHAPEWFLPGHSEAIPGFVLSGCTLYKRPVLERIKFRYDIEAPNAFPDAHMYNDATQSGFRAVNFTGIKCDHLHDANGGRGHNELC